MLLYFFSIVTLWFLGKWAIRYINKSTYSVPLGLVGAFIGHWVGSTFGIATKGSAHTGAILFTLIGLTWGLKFKQPPPPQR